MNTTDKHSSPLSAAWLAAGAVLFGIALGTPLLVLKYLPDPRVRTDVALASDAGPVEPPIDQADDAPDYPEMSLASNTGLAATDQMGSLATLIDRQGQASKPTQAPDIRRLILEVVTVDLESSTTVDALEHLHLPIRDCDAPALDNDATLTSSLSEIEVALHALRGLPARVPYEKIAGPLALNRTASFEGMRVEFCSDLTRISAVEILPLNVELEPIGLINIAALGIPLEQDSGSAAIDRNDTRSDRPVPRTIIMEQLTANAEPIVTSRSHTQVALVSPGKAPLPQASPETDFELAMGAQVAKRSEGVPLNDAKPVQTVLAQALPPVRTRGAGERSIGRVATFEPPELLAFHGRAFEISEDVALPPSQTPLGVVTEAMNAPVLATAAPVRLSHAFPTMIASDVTTEGELNLNRRARFQTQVRLALLGHDPKGIDGIFGEGTRNAIAALQETEALPPTGYLDAFTLALLKEKSEQNYADWRARRIKKRKQAARVVPKTVPVRMAPQRIATSPRARRAPACARDRKGIIISNQSFDCDLNVLRESLGLLFGKNG